MSQTPQHSTRVQALRPPSLGAAGVPPHRPARASGERVAEGRLSDGEGTGGNALTGASPNARLPVPLAPPPSRAFSQTQHPRFQPPWTQGLPQAHGQDPAPTRQTGQWASEPFFFFFKAGNHLVLFRGCWSHDGKTSMAQNYRGLAHHTIQIIRSLQFIRVFEFNSHFVCS